ncbi:[protein-PII] uridylyltransferase [Amphibiibacter pelophylacis]|uniref:[protein-PII] uridylyltransferase n=1 Tax=Amphibiibacter pelophylacis TaxID=1799477 RepID=A0ACC6NZU3_9BURK
MTTADPRATEAEALNATLAELGERYREQRRERLERFASQPPRGPSVSRLLRDLCTLTDQALHRLWQALDMPHDMALLAVGGYGQGELFPQSDVDVLLLTGAHDHPLFDSQVQRLERFIAACWDGGFPIGSSVRSVDTCLSEAANDITVQTALLTARPLAGNAALSALLAQRLRGSIDPLAFFQAKQVEMRQRHARFDDSPYTLEPNCKESPGGLRDVHVLRWVAQAAGLGDAPQNWVDAGIVTAFEAERLVREDNQIKLIRAHLHLLARRREDRLLFDVQTPLAERLGLHDETSVDGRITLRASEKLMHRYYWSAKAIVQLNRIIWLNLAERLGGSQPEGETERLDAEFCRRGGLLDVQDEAVFERQPQAVLRTFLWLQRRPDLKGLSPRTLRALYNAREHMDTAFRHDPVNKRQFLEILQAPQGQTRVFRLMNNTSVLGRYLWVFRRIVGRMQHDLFHVYTVDQHILMVLRNVRRFFIAEHAHEYPFCSQLAADFDAPWLLYVAALFHDIAKGRGGDHSKLGAVEVRRFARNHGLADADRDLVEFLVREHLTMSQTAQKQDISDPDVVHAFARVVQTPRRLVALYLLTVADIRGTGPKVWNGWKGTLLENLFKSTQQVLGSGEAPSRGSAVQQRKAAARQELALHSVLPGSENDLWALLDVSYFVRHDASEIAWHARMLWRYLHQTQPTVRARPNRAGDGLQVVVYSGLEVPHQFARICAFFDRVGLSVLDAKIHTTRHGFLLDTFQVTLEESDDTAWRDRIALIEHELSQALLRTEPLPAPRKGRVSRRVKSFPLPPEVDLTADDKGSSWVLTVSAVDRPGLLYAVAYTLSHHAVNIQHARISTMGERIQDTFLVDGACLQQVRAQGQLEQALLAALTPG